MKLPVTYIWSHDSIGPGEDGPTHQPIEHLASLRLIPGLDIVRPADAEETAVVWRTILNIRDRPAGLVLSRQGLPIYDRAEFGSAEGAARGGYILAEASTAAPKVIQIATGSEVSIAMSARDILEAEGTPTRVVSLPCIEWFNDQTTEYQHEILPPEVRARVSVEAGVTTGWRDLVGSYGKTVGINHYGASADAATLYDKFGMPAAAVVGAAREALIAVEAGSA